MNEAGESGSESIGGPMPVRVFRVAWGAVWVRGGDTGLVPFIENAASHGDDGVEVPLPVLMGFSRTPVAGRVRDALERTGLQLATGFIIRAGDVDGSLRWFRRQVEAAVAWGAVRAPVITGLDHAPHADAVRFLRAAAAMAADAGVEVAFETHRGSPLAHPDATMRILDELPDLPLNADYSHWTVTTASLLEHHADVLERCARNAIHIHARVGFEQRPQVPDPRRAVAEAAYESHRRWWAQILSTPTSLTSGRIVSPEFGPAPYAPVDRRGRRSVGVDVVDINRWIAAQARAGFSADVGRAPRADGPSPH